jgi:hypothetical protein
MSGRVGKAVRLPGFPAELSRLNPELSGKTDVRA